MSSPVLPCSSRELLRASGRRRNVELRTQACPGRIFRGNVALEIVYGRRLDQVDRAAAKSSASHSRANQSRLRGGDFHHQIEFLATDLIVVAQAAMRLLHQCAESLAVSSLEGINRVLHPRVFRDDVAAPRKHLRRKSCTLIFQLIKRNVPKRAN